MGFLTDLIGDLRRRLERDPLDESGLRSIAMPPPPPRPFEDALRGTPPALIGEYKRSSPSAGAIAEPDPASQARGYQGGGAAAGSRPSARSGLRRASPCCGRISWSTPRR